jgi:hypothetical protein
MRLYFEMARFFLILSSQQSTSGRHPGCTGKSWANLLPDFQDSSPTQNTCSLYAVGLAHTIVPRLVLDGEIQVIRPRCEAAPAPVKTDSRRPGRIAALLRRWPLSLRAAARLAIQKLSGKADAPGGPFFRVKFGRGSLMGDKTLVATRDPNQAVYASLIQPLSLNS